MSEYPHKSIGISDAWYNGVNNMGKFYVFIALALTSCATSPRERWKDVRIGQSLNRAVETMGDPTESLTDPKSGDRLYSWHLQETCDICEAVSSKSGVIDAKMCRKDRECQQAAAAFMRAYFESTATAPQPQAPAQQQRIQTNCTSQSRFGTVYTDCESH